MLKSLRIMLCSIRNHLLIGYWYSDNKLHLDFHGYVITHTFLHLTIITILCHAQVDQVLLSLLNRCRDHRSNKFVQNQRPNKRKSQRVLAPSLVFFLNNHPKYPLKLAVLQPWFSIPNQSQKRQLKQMGSSTKSLGKVCISVTFCEAQCTLSCGSWTQAKLSAPLPPTIIPIMQP